MNTLFPEEENLSPREAWRCKHEVKTYSTLAGWSAVSVAHTAHGKTEDEAMSNWAAKARASDWDNNAPKEV